MTHFGEFDRFLHLDREARRYGGTISKLKCSQVAVTTSAISRSLSIAAIPSEKLLECLKGKIVSLLKHADTFGIKVCKHFAVKWMIKLDFANADEEDLWEELDPTDPPAPTTYSLPTTSMLGASMQRENMSHACRKLSSLQQMCMKEGYLIDRPPDVLQASRGIEEPIEEWRNILCLLRIPLLHGSNAEAPSSSGLREPMLSVSNVSTTDQAPEDDDPLGDHCSAQSIEQANPPCTELSEALQEFIEELVPTQSSEVSQILRAVDSHIERVEKQSEVRDSDHLAERNDNQLLVVHRLDRSAISFSPEQISLLHEEVKELRDENQTLKLQVACLVQEMKSIKNSSIVTSELVDRSVASSESTIPDDMAKAFNLIPKKLGEFYIQMKNGDSTLCRFDDIPDSLRKHPRTKGAYSKRKAVYHFIEQHPDGPQECMQLFGRLTTTQLYEHHVKKSRKSMS